MSIVWGIVAILALIIILGFILSDKVHVERTIMIDASPEDVFALVGDFNQFNRWSPWQERDPEMDQTIEGAPGVGQTYRWDSDKSNVGSGRQEVIAHEAPTKFATKLDFGERGGGIATFDIQPAEGGSRVTWSMDTHMRDGVPTPMKPMATYMGLFMDKLVGADYEKGLEKLKAEVEANA